MCENHAKEILLLNKSTVFLPQGCSVLPLLPHPSPMSMQPGTVCDIPPPSLPYLMRIYIFPAPPHPPQKKKSKTISPFARSEILPLPPPPSPPHKLPHILSLSPSFCLPSLC
eukprot:Sspe_Gene.81267::Locus_51928_Transcript_1_1_Confidence_1.000_Length_374::g.81267::m.81267